MGTPGSQEPGKGLGLFPLFRSRFPECTGFFLPPSLGLAHVGTPIAGQLTLAPIWLPHWPAWMCTISLMLASNG